VDINLSVSAIRIRLNDFINRDYRSNTPGNLKNHCGDVFEQHFLSITTLVILALPLDVEDSSASWGREGSGDGRLEFLLVPLGQHGLELLGVRLEVAHFRVPLVVEPHAPDRKSDKIT